MSLLDEAMETVFIVDKHTVPDGEGGVITEYVISTEIQAAFSFNSSIQARIGEAADSIGRYTITTRKNVNLEYHTVLKRQRDGKIFRVTSDGDDNYTPGSAFLDMRQVEAEEWELPKA